MKITRLVHSLAVLAGTLTASSTPVFALGLSELTATSSTEGLVHVFGVDSDAGDAAVHLWQAELGGPWQSREPLGGSHRDVAALPRAEGRFEAFGIGTDGAVWRSAQPADDYVWQPWETLGGDAKRLSAALSGERAAVFYIGADDALWYAWRDGADAAWSEWQSEGSGIKQLSAAAADGGSFRLFTVGLEDEVWTGTLDPAAGGRIAWERLGGQATDVAAVRGADGSYEVIASGFDGVVSRNRQVDGAYAGWEGLGGAARRVELVATTAGATLFALGDEGVVQSATRGADAVWSELAGTPEAEPLETTFDGTALVEIPDQDVSEDKALTLEIRFSVDRTRLVVTSFPPITTEPFDTPFGSSRSTVSMVDGASGTFEPSSGALELPITLKFDQSLDAPIVNEDATARFTLATSGQGGRTYDGGEIALGGSSSFEGIGGGVNPLDGLDVSVVITGTLDPRL